MDARSQDRRFTIRGDAIATGKMMRETANKPELLAPAKNLERLKVAIAYGADAVYVGGQRYGLRARADNFTDGELAQAVAFAHQHGAKVYVTLNAFLHDADFSGLPDYCQFLEEIGVDAAIASDFGVIRTIQASSQLAVHLSTQASCLNVEAAKLWKSLGVSRLILGRELSVAEAGRIREQADIEVELFAHGAMCMAYSGHCTISNFTAGRDSNRGGCIQSCRMPYHLEAQGNRQQSTSNKGETAEAVTFMSSKDLSGLQQVGDFFRQRIASLKVEGRMKSSFYVAMTCRAYRQAIDAWAEGKLDAALMAQLADELDSIPHRDYSSGSLAAPAGPDSVYKPSGMNAGSGHYLGLVTAATPQHLVLRLVDAVAVGDTIEIVPFRGAPLRWPVGRLLTVTGEQRPFMRQNSVACLPREDAPAIAAQVARLNVIRVAARESVKV